MQPLTIDYYFRYYLHLVHVNVSRCAWWPQKLLSHLNDELCAGQANGQRRMHVAVLLLLLLLLRLLIQTREGQRWDRHDGTSRDRATERGVRLCGSYFDLLLVHIGEITRLSGQV